MCSTLSATPICLAFADAPMDLIDQVLEEGAKFCEGVLAPLNKIGDEHGCSSR
jgi:hypothetical protein